MERAERIVLVVDNEPAVARLLVEALGTECVPAEAVTDGEAALRRAAAGGVGVALCDLDMPGMGGEEVVEALAAMDAAPRILVMSGFLPGPLRQRLSALESVVGFLTKPFDVLEMARRVRGLLEGEAGGGASPEPGGG